MIMNVELEKVENGWVVTLEDRKWVAADVEDVKDIIDEILVELEDLVE